VIAFNSDYCDLSLVNEARKNVDKLEEQGDYFFIFVGHSLGGTAAQCLATIYPNSRSISLNGGAAATNPILTGPGISRARFYHIMGDLISTHMGPQAAQVIRVAKGDRKFGVLYPHSSTRFLASDGPWEYISATDEDEAWQKYGRGFTESSGRLVKGVLAFTNLIRLKRLPANTPIPGSRRWVREKR
jgi:pimeloyl-ACP methyl ester carboxylesterase